MLEYPKKIEKSRTLLFFPSFLMLHFMQTNIAKQAAGYKALEWIRPDMIVGLGSGSTAAYFIQALIARSKEGLKVETVASSMHSQKMAEAGGLIVRDINEVSRIDVTVDGADEIDTKKRMIKGGGGAHVREKILASCSKAVIIIIDPSKIVPAIGTRKLPIEIIPFGAKQTEAKIRSLGYQGSWRFDQNRHFVKTDNHNFLWDLHFTTPPAAPEKVHEELKNIPGVVDTGFFFHLADVVIVGQPDGSTQIQ